MPCAAAALDLPFHVAGMDRLAERPGPRCSAGSCTLPVSGSTSTSTTRLRQGDTPAPGGLTPARPDDGPPRGDLAGRELFEGQAPGRRPRHAAAPLPSAHVTCFDRARSQVLAARSRIWRLIILCRSHRRPSPS